MQEQIERGRAERDRALMAKAQRASHVAKLATGASKRAAYRRKNQCLAALLGAGAGRVTRHVRNGDPLLRVRLGGVSLHSHPRWMREAGIKWQPQPTLLEGEAA